MECGSGVQPQMVVYCYLSQVFWERQIFAARMSHLAEEDEAGRLYT
jgi:hypothetical protein